LPISLFGIGHQSTKFLNQKNVKKQYSCPTRVTPFSLSLKLAYRGPTFLKAFFCFASSPVGRATPFLNALSEKSLSNKERAQTSVGLPQLKSGSLSITYKAIWQSIYESRSISECIFLPQGVSDHSPVLVSLGEPYKKRKFTAFIFFNSWATNPQFLLPSPPTGTPTLLAHLCIK
jgi:hypothetical protein